MPKRTDIKTILILGSGPIVIGQACEFDYSGAQACKVLRQEGYRVVLVNSNPATIMTDPEFADATYIEPLTPAAVEQIISKERPDAILPTLGGQTALNLAVALAENGVLERYGVEMLGASLETIRLAEDRRAFYDAMEEIGLDQAKSMRATTVAEAQHAVEAFGFPLLVRASFTLGGAGSGIVYDQEAFDTLVREGLEASPISEVQIDECLLGCKEFELEVMRDKHDNCVVICAIENLDAMGVHTGDSITVAPTMTLSDAQYQHMRNAAFAVMRRVGVATGGSNVQFALHPETGRMIIIEMNPRVSRSSALASKATGFPIAKIAALLAVGYTLDEIPNDITKTTLAAFEPSIDYVVTKIPRWAFEKFPDTDPTLGTMMKAVGEVMAIGRTFTESLHKAIRSLEDGSIGLTGRPGPAGAGGPITDAELEQAIQTPTAHRIHDLDAALTRGWSVERVAELSGWDPWFIDQLLAIVQLRRELRACEVLTNVDDDLLREVKRHGFGDDLIGDVLGISATEVRAHRHARGLRPVYKTVDTCAAEFDAQTPYHYSTWEEETEVRRADRKRVLILGSGPNRIGQGIEFDYCCVHAVWAMAQGVHTKANPEVGAGYETVMINCNPETVSTDYDTAHRLYFEPLTVEDVLEVAYAEGGEGYSDIAGAFVQFGGQTPLRIAAELAANGLPIMGTSPEAIDLAEDRGEFNRICNQLGIAQPPGAIANSKAEALHIAEQIGFPVLVRPSYVLGGRAMEIVYSPAQMRAWLDVNAGAGQVLVDRFLEHATEVDVDAVFDGTDIYIGGVMEHIEEAGVHSGDSSCVVPPITLSAQVMGELKRITKELAQALNTRGLINIQFAVRDGEVLVLEANPRASRTVPFISKATGIPMAKVAAQVMAGATLDEVRVNGKPLGADFIDRPPLPWNAVKEAVLPFNRFLGADSRLGPEMRSTGEVMGIDADFGHAFAKANGGTGKMTMPTKGHVFVSLADRDKRSMIFPVKQLKAMGFDILATQGTASALKRVGIDAEIVAKVGQGARAIDQRIRDGEIVLVLNTPTGSGARSDGYEIRAAAVMGGVPSVTTAPGILVTILGIEAQLRADSQVKSIQDYLAALDHTAGYTEEEQPA